MPITQLTMNNQLSWQLQATKTGFTNLVQGTDNISSNLAGLAVPGTFNQLFAAQYSLAASGGTQTFDLRSFTNLVDESVTLGHALTIFVTVTGTNANVNLVPGASNGLVWFFGTGTDSINIPTGSSFMFSGPAAGPGEVVDATHKTMTLTNNGSGAATVKVVILGSTT